jgi:hypothetical protein
MDSIDVRKRIREHAAEVRGRAAYARAVAADDDPADCDNSGVLRYAVDREREAARIEALAL